MPCLSLRTSRCQSFQQLRSRITRSGGFDDQHKSGPKHAERLKEASEFVANSNREACKTRAVPQVPIIGATPSCEPHKAVAKVCWCLRWCGCSHPESYHCGMVGREEYEVIEQRPWTTDDSYQGKLREVLSNSVYDGSWRLYAIGDIMFQKGNLIGNARQDHDVNVLDHLRMRIPDDQTF